MRHALPCVLALGLVAPLGGCAGSAANTVEPGFSRTEAKEELIDKAVVDPGLASRVSVESVQVARDLRLRRVAANLRNRTRDASFFQYRYRWFDKNGIQIDTPLDAWQTAHVLGGDTGQLVGIAPNAEAVDWSLSIRGDGN
ncbi:YcfL family protein [Phycisphaera mikurensis]|uniref:DUF1425 domain-containing protein n=1 Tax=Phycisphaera mikurensis (strain NBRC 102666 / KCTC 22515 / FYK2301M01) TaxID=1142394 RepID=I0IHA0_PHYMF|nr:YcfL family protein [Phycisphaera mikurensis]MBB6440887.1 uncharacterized protein YcfL [Phycisphaera mikurensis]BAM04638.1 hypothetical protein PSMK_24790 [Phycisphaera mikurensis NBRC 102666]